MFTYDSSPPLDVQDLHTAAGPGHSVRDLTYASPLGGRVPAYLVTPDDPGACAALVYLHPGQGNRESFLAEACALAPSGVASLLIDAPFRRPDFQPGDPQAPPAAAAAAAAHLFRQLVIDIRRGIDLLAVTPGVDPGRIGYVGHSLGATWGGVLAGIERRLRALVLMAGYPSLTAAYRCNPHPVLAGLRDRLGAELERYLEVLAPLDAEHYIGLAPPAAVFFQFARDDEFITRQEAEHYFALAAEPKQAAWYDTDHLFTGDRASARDRAAWLAGHLGFRPPD